MSTPTVAQHLAICRAELGYAESPPGSNNTKYAACAGHANGAAWCATYQVCMAHKSGLKLPSESAYTPAMAQAFQDGGKWGQSPKPGAFGFLYFPSKTRIAHVFIVEAVQSDGSFLTIEGNTDEAGGRTGGKVMRHRRTMARGTGAYVTGFGYPMYAVAAPKPTPAPTPKPVPAPTPVQPAQEEDMAELIRLDGKQAVWLYNGIQRRHVKDPKAMDALHASGHSKNSTPRVLTGVEAADAARSLMVGTNEGDI